MTGIDAKIVLLGQAAVGKTCLVKRYINQSFDEKQNYQITIANAFATKELTVDGTKVCFGIWDTAGSERYESMVKIYYRGASAAIVCYDISDAGSFAKAKYWIQELRSVEEDCKVYLCATKSDTINLGLNASPDLSAVKKYADNLSCPFFVTSSKTGENIDELFNQIAQDYVANPNKVKQGEDNLITLHQSPKRQWCCCG